MAETEVKPLPSRLDTLPFAVTIFCGAFLLFLVQPLIGKSILPWFGGTPGVWTTCLLFFSVSPARRLRLCALPESLSVASLTTRCARRAFVPSGCNPANHPERVPQTYWRGIADGPDSAAAHVEHWLALPRVVGHRPIDSGVVCQGASGTFTVPIVRAIQRRITARAAGISISC